MPDNKLPKKLLLGQGKGGCPHGCPRLNFNDVAVRPCQLHRFNKPLRMLKTGCFGETEFDSHVPSSSRAGKR